MANEASLDFWVNAQAASGLDLKIQIETQTGKPITIMLRDKETFAVVANLIVSPEAATTIGTALMLAATMKQTEQAGIDS